MSNNTFSSNFKRDRFSYNSLNIRHQSKGDSDDSDNEKPLNKNNKNNKNLNNNSSSGSNNIINTNITSDEIIKNHLQNQIDEIKRSIEPIKINLNNIKNDIQKIEENHISVNNNKQQQQQKKTSKQIELENLIESYSNLPILTFDDYYVPDGTTTTTTSSSPQISPFIRLPLDAKIAKASEFEERLNKFDFTHVLRKLNNESLAVKYLTDYKRFVILKSLEGDENDEKLSPSQPIAKLLTLHLQDRKNYQEMLVILEMSDLKYKPQKLTRNKYEKTLELLKKYFNVKKLKADIWPPHYLK